MKLNRLQVYENPTGSENPSDWNRTPLLRIDKIAQMCRDIYNDKVLMQSICDCDFHSFALLMHLGTAGVPLPFDDDVRTFTLISKKYPQYVFVTEKYDSVEHLYCVATYYVNGYYQSVDGVITREYKLLEPDNWY